MDDRKKLNISQGKFVSLFVLLGLVVVLPILLLIIKQRVQLAPRAAIGVGQMYFASTSYTLAPNGTVSVLLNPGGDSIGFAEVQVNFDNSKVQLESDPVIPSGNPLSTQIVVDSRDAANAAGSITMTLALPPGVTAPTSVFEYAQLSFAAVGGGSDSTDLSISAGKQLWETGGTAVPYTTQNTTLVLNPASATPTDEPAPSNTPYPTSTVAPGNPTSTPVPTYTPAPTNTPGPGATNACGGTCGSNANCNAGLTCYAGYCRNPSCQTVANCSCPGPTAVPNATSTPRPYVPGATSTPIYAPTAYPTSEMTYIAPTISYDNPLLGGEPRTDVDLPEVAYQTEPIVEETWWQALIRIITNFLRLVFGFR